MATLRILTVADLHELLLEGQAIQVLDVRSPEEYAAGHIDGAVLVPHDELTSWPDALDAEQPTAVINGNDCAKHTNFRVSANLTN